MEKIFKAFTKYSKIEITNAQPYRRFSGQFSKRQFRVLFLLLALNSLVNVAIQEACIYTLRMEIINSDEIRWPQVFLENEFIVVNYQPEINCPGCKEINELFQKLSGDKEFEKVKFLWVDSRNNPIAEQFIKKRQTPFIAAFKEGFLVECNNVSDEEGLRQMLERLFNFKFKL